LSVLAFVAGTQEGLLLEKALKMGEALRPGYHLDIDAELQLVEKVKSELTAAKSVSSDQSEKTIMKELGLKRSGQSNVPLYFKNITLSTSACYLTCNSVSYLATKSSI
jgi:hypothetical protein